MNQEVLNSLLALYAASSAVGLAYLSLPDYRYRNAITEYFKYYIDRTVRLNTKISNNSIEYEIIGEMVAKEKVRQCEAESVSNKSTALKVSPWLRFLEDLVDMPRGHIPNQRIAISKEDRANHKTDRKNWFLTRPGWCFRHIFMVHRDNTFVTILAGLSLALLSIIISFSVFSIKVPSFSTDYVLTAAFLMLSLFFLSTTILR